MTTNRLSIVLHHLSSHLWKGGMGLLLLLLAACSSNDEDSFAISDPNSVDNAQAAYSGIWTFGNGNGSYNQMNTTNNPNNNQTISSVISAINNDGTLSLLFPMQLITPLAVPNEKADEATQNAYLFDYSFPYFDVGYTSNSTYWHIDKPRYVYHTRYGGAVHKIAVYMSNCSAVCSSDYSQLGIALHVDSLQNADKTVARFQPQLEMIYVSKQRIR